VAHPYAPSGVGFPFFNPQLRPLSGSRSRSDAEFNTKIASFCRRLVIFPPFRAGLTCKTPLCASREGIRRDGRVA
jgi:hypothetical protein